MLRFFLGVMTMDMIKNEHIRGTAQVERLETREARLRWFAHLQRRDSKYIGRKDAQVGATEEIHGCGTTGHVDSWCERRRCKG